MNTQNKLNTILQNIAYVILPAIAVICLCNYNDSMYQTEKDIDVAKALLAFTLYLFIVQKVKLLNWASLGLTVIYVPLFYLYRSRFIESEDILAAIDIKVWTLWITMMILLDIIIKFDKSKLKKIDLISLGLYLLMVLAMTICRNGRTEPVVFLFPILLNVFITITRDQRQALIYRFCDSWLIAFLYIMIRSFVTNPYEGGRYYGSFVNIGAFGVFIGAVFAMALFRTISAKRRYGRKSVQYALCLVWMALVIASLWIIDTRTLIVGILLSLFFVFIYENAELSEKQRKRRISIVLGIVLAGILLFAFMLIITPKLNEEYWKAASENGGIMGPLAFFVYRFIYMFDKTTSFNAKVFPKGSVINVIDKFTSGRIALCKVFIEKIKFFGTIGEGIMVKKYYAFSAHNQYVHILYTYGILGGGMYILWLIYSMVETVKRWRRERSEELLFLLCLLPMTLGLMTGESMTMYFPTIFMTFVAMRPLFIKDKEEVFPEKVE